MPRLTADSISIGGVAAIAVLVTGTIAPAPIWVLFAAWAATYLVGTTVRDILDTGLHLLTGVWKVSSFEDNQDALSVLWGSGCRVSGPGLFRLG